jgi:DNA-binding protein
MARRRVITAHGRRPLLRHRTAAAHRIRLQRLQATLQARRRVIRRAVEAAAVIRRVVVEARITRAEDESMLG